MKEARKIQPMKPRPVPGTFAFASLLAASVTAVIWGVITGKESLATMATVYLVGATIVATMRLIEADRRAGL